LTWFSLDSVPRGELVLLWHEPEHHEDPINAGFPVVGHYDAALRIYMDYQGDELFPVAWQELPRALMDPNEIVERRP
jgi:hypothetical protein